MRLVLRGYTCVYHSKRIEQTATSESARRMSKRKKPEESSEEGECTLALQMIPVIPVVNHDATFWKNLQESSEEYERRKQCRRRSQPLTYHCKHCLAVMNNLPMSMDTLIHLASDPNHLELMRVYDGVKETNYFIETLFQMNKVLGHLGHAA